jgi:hypothetical protein
LIAVAIATIPNDSDASAFRVGGMGMDFGNEFVVATVSKNQYFVNIEKSCVFMSLPTTLFTYFFIIP